MKNLYLLLTLNPSRLIQKRIAKELKLSSLNNPQLWNNVNIYITNSEEIKVGDWRYDRVSNTIGKAKFGSKPTEDSQYLKIILTTDQDLIKDGVQAIEDEFLEWFVAKANDSGKPIDIVEVKHIIKDYVDEQDAYGYDVDYYKIIIPKEESNLFELPKALPDDVFYELLNAFKVPKEYFGKEEPKNPNNQEVMFHEEHKEYFYEDFIDGKFVTVWLGKDYIPQEEHKSKLTNQKYLDKMKTDGVTEEFLKQETLEEACKRIKKELDYSEFDYTSFKLGIKYQQERSYSEEEVLGFGKFCLNKVADFLNGKSDEEDGKEYSIEELFEQFKKK